MRAQKRFGWVVRTFCIHREVDFYDVAVEAKYTTKVGLHDVARKVGDYNDLGFWLRV